MVMTRKRSAEAAILEAQELKDRLVNPPQWPRIQRHRQRSGRHSGRKASAEQLSAFQCSWKGFAARNPNIWLFCDRYNADVWFGIASFLDAKDLVNLALTCRFFAPIVLDERLWKALCLERLGIRETVTIHSDFSWKFLYRTSFDVNHAYHFHESEKHRAYMRIGAFTIVSDQALAAGRLWQRVSKKKKVGENTALCLVSGVKPGIWIADLHFLRCPVCETPECAGTMQSIEFRNWELFMHDEYRNGTWSYKKVAVRNIRENCDVAAGAVFDYKRLIERDNANSDILNFKSWTGAAGEFEPRASVSNFGAAASTNLHKNEGLQVSFHVMRAGNDGPVLAIRVNQYLV